MPAYTAGDEMASEEAQAIVTEAVQDALRKKDNTKPSHLIASR